MKKRFIPIILLISALVLAGCQGSSSSESSQSSSDQEEKATASNDIAESAKKTGEDDPENSIVQETEELSQAIEEPAGNSDQSSEELTGDSGQADNAGQEDSSGDKESTKKTKKKKSDSKALGAAFFSPNIDSETGLIPRGGNTLHAYFERAGVKGNGKITVYSNGDAEFCTADLSKEKYCYQDNDDGTLKDLNWESGTHLVIKLPRIFDNSDNFYILMEEGAFSSEDGKIKSKAVADKEAWRFDVQNFGVEFYTDNGDDAYVGQEVYARVLIRQPAKKALIENYDVNRLSFNEKEFRDEDGDLRIKIKQLGEDPFYVNFYNSDRELISSLPITYNGILEPDPEKVKKEDKVIGL